MHEVPATHEAVQRSQGGLVLRSLSDPSQEIDVAVTELAQSFSARALEQLIEVGAKFGRDPRTGKWR